MVDRLLGYFAFGEDPLGTRPKRGGLPASFLSPPLAGLTAPPSFTATAPPVMAPPSLSADSGLSGVAPSLFGAPSQSAFDSFGQTPTLPGQPRTFGSQQPAPAPGSSANQERDQQRQSQNSPGAVAASIRQGVVDGSLTPNQFNSGLSAGDAASACGPAAAVAFARAFGRFPTLQEAVGLAKEFGWNASAGMAGPQSQVNLLRRMGVNAKLGNGADWAGIAAEIQAGRPVIIDTPQHYFVVEGFDPETNRFDFGNSALVLRASGGRRWLTPQDLARMGYQPRSTITMG